MEELTLGRKISQLRKKRRLTSEKMAEMCGINAAYLRQIECGSGTPSLTLFQTICTVLNASADYLLGQDTTKLEPEEAITCLLAKLRHLTPNQIEMFIEMADVMISHLGNE